MFGLLVKVEENNLKRQMAQKVKVFPIYGRPPKFLPPEDTIVFFFVPNKGIRAFAIYTGSKWLDPGNKAELDKYKTYESEKEWNNWIKKYRVRGLIFYKDLKPANIPWQKVSHIIRYSRGNLQPAYLPLDQEITGELVTYL